VFASKHYSKICANKGISEVKSQETWGTLFCYWMEQLEIIRDLQVRCLFKLVTFVGAEHVLSTTFTTFGVWGCFKVACIVGGFPAPHTFHLKYPSCRYEIVPKIWVANAYILTLNNSHEHKIDRGSIIC
jgi:hypothetical protein